MTRNPRGAAAVEAPRRRDGGFYRFEMIYDGLKYRAYADTATDLCGLLIPGYAELEDDTEQAAARIRFAVGMQVQLQAAIATEADLEACTPAERDVLLGPRHVPPAVARWEADVPLVLVDVFYEPQGELPRPVGRPRGGGEPDSNLMWLRPSDEVEFLSSLHRAGLVVLSVAE